MNQAVLLARSFFFQLDTPKSGELLQGMDIYTMIRLIPFGQRMRKEAEVECIRERVFGNVLEANAIAKDVTTIQKNLNTIEKAYKMAMN